MAYYLTVNIESMGTQTYSVSANGTLTPDGSSTIGHMWYSLDDGSGNPPANYGFAPADEAEGKDRLNGPGKVKQHDDSEYNGDPAYSRTIEITEEQYDAMKNFGDDAAAGLNEKYLTYDAKQNNCIDFVYDGLSAGGFNPQGVEGNWIPM